MDTDRGSASAATAELLSTVDSGIWGDIWGDPLPPENPATDLNSTIRKQLPHQSNRNVGPKPEPHHIMNEQK
eukprot:3090418-Amphidinium_carterae.1